MKIRNESGIALITALLILILMGALLVTFFVRLDSSQRMIGMGQDSDRAFAGAYAALERLTQSMGNMLDTDTLNDAAIQALENTPIKISNMIEDGEDGEGNTRWIDHEGNKITVSKPRISKSDTTTSTIRRGAYEGLLANVTSYTIGITARSETGEEVTLEREVQVVQIPVFQFGIFSEYDMDFWALTKFNFGGRVHSNGSIYLRSGATTSPQSACGSDINSTGCTAGTWITDRVTAFKNVFTKTRANGRNASTDGNVVYIAKQYGSASSGPGKYASQQSQFVVLGNNDGEDSASPNDYRPTSIANQTKWKTNVSDKYNGFLNNGYTGAYRLDPPITGSGNITPIDIIKRGKNEDAPEVSDQRYYNLAGLRILLSDTAADIKNLPGLSGSNPVALAGTYTSGSVSYGFARVPATNNANYGWQAGTPLIGGYILVQRQKPDKTWVDATDDFLKRGVTGRDMTEWCNSANTTSPASYASPLLADTSPIIRLQRFADIEITHNTSEASNATAECKNFTTDGTKFWPLALYDAREGLVPAKGTVTDANVKLTYNGVMHYVELDVKNLSAWLKQYKIGYDIIGSDTNELKNNSGYVVYFSDRRTSNVRGSADMSAYQYESVSGWDLDGDGSTASSVKYVNSVMQGLEGPYGTDLGKNNTYGSGELNCPNTFANTPHACVRLPGDSGTFNFNADLAQKARAVARRARPIYFRRALKLVNGAKIDLGKNPERTAPFGLAIVSENPVYVQGDYNYSGTATETAFKASPIQENGSVGASVIADGVTILSNAWKDCRSFGDIVSTTNNTTTVNYNRCYNISDANTRLSAQNNRTPSTTYYRMAIIAGKNKSHNNNSGATKYNDSDAFGTDGGVHNFLRMLENWSESDNVFYRGSMISMYYSQQAMSPFTIGNQYTIYYVPQRRYSYEDLFMENTDTLPPRTPMVRYTDILSFSRVTGKDRW